MFIRNKATTKSLRLRGTIHGVGVNDAWYTVSYYSKGKKYNCPVYYHWASMLQRCYSKVSLNRRAAYLNCSVDAKWHKFSEFEKWYTENYIEGYDLDKDLKIPGNTTYGPDQCLFIPHSVNTLLSKPRKKVSSLKLGVSLCKRTNRFRSSVRIKGINKNLGAYATEDEAHLAYIKAKNKNIEQAAKENPNIAAYILQYINQEVISI